MNAEKNEMRPAQSILLYKNEVVVNRIAKELNVSKEDAELQFREMLKFLYCCAISKKPLTPSKKLDEPWHTFVLFTRDYEAFCKNYLGKFIHHVPDIDESIETKKANKKRYEQTYEVATAVFGNLPEFMWPNPAMSLANANCGGCHGCSGECYGCSTE